MASPQMRMRSDSLDRAPKSRRPALRLLGIERSEEIFPVLLEEIVGLGFPRALVTRVDFETSEILPTDSLNCSKAFTQRFRSSLFAIENPLVRILHSQEPERVRERGARGSDLYYYPLIFVTRRRAGRRNAPAAVIAWRSKTITRG
jgi:hypothetical protein